MSQLGVVKYLLIFSRTTNMVGTQKTGEIVNMSLQSQLEGILGDRIEDEAADVDTVAEDEDIAVDIAAISVAVSADG